MGIFLGILNGGADLATAPELSEAQQAEFMAAWARWAGEAGEALVDSGRPLYRKQRVTSQGVEPFEDAKVAYMLLSAPSHEAAVDIVRGHPHLTLFQGNSIDVIECPEVPIA